MREVVVRTAFFVIMGVPIHLASAQSVTQAGSVDAQPQMRVNRGAFEACGVRVLAMPKEDAGFPMQAVDYSFSVYLSSGNPDAMGLAKFTAFTIPSAASLAKLDTRPVAISDAWFKPFDREMPTHEAKPLRGEDKNDLLVPLMPGPLLLFIGSLVEGPQKALVGIRAVGQSTTAVMAHTIQLTTPDADALRSCLLGLIERSRSRKIPDGPTTGRK